MKQDLSPQECAHQIARVAEEQLPEEWTTDQLADFWHRLTEEGVLRLVRLKPEMVKRWPPQ